MCATLTMDPQDEGGTQAGQCIESSSPRSSQDVALLGHTQEPFAVKISPSRMNTYQKDRKQSCLWGKRTPQVQISCMPPPSRTRSANWRVWVLSLLGASFVCTLAGVLTAMVVRRLAQHMEGYDELPLDAAFDAPHIPPKRPTNTTEFEVVTDADSRSDMPKMCNTKELCERLDAYVRNVINHEQEPCEDFYEYVCSKHPQSGRASERGIILPYRLRSTARLMYDLPRTLMRYYTLREKTYREYPGVFISQATFFLPNCTSIYSRNGLGWDPWTELLAGVGLQGWPFSSDPPDFDVPAVCGAVDALLGVFPFVQVKVKSEYDMCCAAQLDGPITVLKRHQLWYTGEDVLNYTQVVSRALSVLGIIPEVQVLAENIVILEMRIEDALTLRRHGVVRERTADSLPKSVHWHWKEYLGRIFYAGALRRNNGMLNTVEVLSEDYLQDLAAIMDNTSVTTLANYMGYRTLVQLSPLLPDEVSFLVSLSHDGDPIPGLAPRLQACVHALERLFPFGVRTFLRMTLGRDNPLRYCTELDVQVERLFNETRWLLAQRVEKAGWLNPVERVIAREKVANMDLAFIGSVMDLNLPASYYNPKAPTFSGKRLLHSYIAIQASNRHVYYHPWTTEREWDFDNRYHVSSLLPGTEYVQGRNTLFVPYGSVAFIQDLRYPGQTTNATNASVPRSPELDVALEPTLSSAIMAAAFAAVDDRGVAVDHRRRWRDWWSRTAFDRFFTLKDCFYRQYKVALERILLQDVALIRDLDELVALSAVLEPVYAHYLGRVIQSGSWRSPVAGLTNSQLFFVQWGLGQCDGRRGISHARRQASFGETPARIRVNTVLQNFEPFAQAFGCQEGNEMSPARRCSVW
ncbi:endothelin-converting enzyme 2-like [Ornithodoros turicata]|uniref:endothelin-converting enzyme 2-like n=1 Tax=Ornithodoros turicata TaxID=34597 RepID=UPI003138751E